MNITPHKATVGMNANTWAMLVYLICIGLGWITGVYYFALVFPLVIYITEKVSGFVRFHAMQAVAILIFNAVTALISDIIYMANAPADLLGDMLGGFLGIGGGPNPGEVIWIITTIVWSIFLVMGAVSASRYDAKPLPLFGALARALAGIGNKNPGASPFEPDPAKQQEYWQAQQYKQQQQQYQQQAYQQPQGQPAQQPNTPQQSSQPPYQGQPMQRPNTPQAPSQQPMQPQQSQAYAQPQPAQQPNMPPQGQPQQQPAPPQGQPPYQPPQQNQAYAPQQPNTPPQGQPPYQQPPPPQQNQPYRQPAPPPPQQQGASAPQEWYRSAPQQPYQPQQPQQQFKGRKSGYLTVGERHVEVDRSNYTGEEIMDRLMQYAQLPGQPYFKKMWNRNYVVIPGAGTKDMMINHTGKPGQFILSEIDRPGTLGKSVLMAGLTSGMADVFESATSNLNQLMDQVANELHRLFGRR